MSEPLIRVEPVPTARLLRPGVTIRLAPPMVRYSLRARYVPAVAQLLGVTVPDRIGTTAGRLACLGPDEWLYRAPGGALVGPDAGSMVAVTDISERAVCLIVEGPHAARLLMSGCPLDLDDFAVGRATRTIYESVEIILIREAEDCFHVEVWPSFAPWLWIALAIASRH